MSHGYPKPAAHPVVLWVGIGAICGSIFGALFTLLILWLKTGLWA